MKLHRATSILGVALLLGVCVGSLGGSQDALAAWPDPSVESLADAMLGAKEVDIKLINKPASTTFGGKPIDENLAATIAGNRTLLAWGNCSVYKKSNGSYTTKRLAATAKPVPCMYLVTGSESQFSEYYVLDEACTGTNKTCLNGYTVESRIDNTITTNPYSTDKTVEVVREIHQNSALDSSQKKAGVGTIDVMRHKATMLWSLGLSVGSKSYSYEMRDPAGNLIGTPISVVRSDSSKGVSPNSCAQLGDDVENFLALCAAAAGAGVALESAVLGGVLGFMTSGVGVVPGVAAGVGLGGTAGAAVAAVGRVYAFIVGKIAEGVCNQYSSGPTPGGGGGPLDPGGGPEEPGGGDEVGCKRCNKWETQYWSTFEINDNGDVEIVGHQETVCVMIDYDAQGTDANMDGWCD
jgi:hypothetical protein